MQTEEMPEEVLLQLEQLEVSARREISERASSQPDNTDGRREELDSRIGCPKARNQAPERIDPFFSRVLDDLRVNEKGRKGRMMSADILAMRCPQFSCSVSIKIAAGGGNKVGVSRSKLDVEDSTGCDYFDAFGSHRFLVVKFKCYCEDNALEAVKNDRLRQFCQDGIKLAGRQYAVLGGEQIGKSDTPTPDEEDADTADYVKGKAVRLWFFAEHDDIDYLPRVRVEELVDWLGSFPIDALPSKINARIKLGFSKTLAACHLEENQILLVNDVVSPDGKVMTDGCGLVSSSLVKQIPYDVSSGCSRQPRSERMSLPAVIQIRMRCKLGLFKGCLIVVSDSNICPSDCVLLRPSMRKAGPSGRMEVCSKSILRVNCTFEHSVRLERGVATYSSCSILLNRPLCLLLNFLGVSSDLFESLMHDEISNLLSATHSRSQAYALVQRYSRIGPTTREANIPIRQHDECLGMKALRFLMAGHSLEEPMLRYCLNMIQLKVIKRLEHCRIKLKESVCLVGVPDPMNQLAEGEVYIILPKDTINVEQALKQPGVHNVVGKVAVTRSPMFHPGDIRLLRAVENDVLRENFKDTSGGVILFSTLGKQTAAAFMSGGDFDGDKYYAIFNKTVVDAVREVEPFDDQNLGVVVEVPGGAEKAVPICNDLHSALFLDIFIGLVNDASESVVGVYGGALKAWLDPCVPGGGPGSENLSKCYRIYLVALDAAKSGRKPIPNRSLLRGKRPHYMTSENAVVSNSVAGKLFDIVKGAGQIISRSGVSYLTIDPDMTFNCSTSTLDAAMEEVLGEVYNKRSVEKGKAYGELWKLYYREYKSEARSIYDETKDPLERNRSFNLLKEKYVNLFNDCAEALLMERYPNLLSDLAASGIADRDRGLVVKTFTDKIRRQLATVVYLVTYQESIADPDRGYKNADHAGARNPRVGFCWEICAEELHKNKGDNVSRRVSQNGDTICGTETLISAELDYLLT